eukprot:GHVH01000433.1.p1 GENE.GHVH01000433.1~~GHVH01000433.1.p1  ORF type:complete len:286 (+),score=33.08 GHVH01000433.1:797-1654(+)
MVTPEQAFLITKEDSPSKFRRIKNVFASTIRHSRSVEEEYSEAATSARGLQLGLVSSSSADSHFSSRPGSVHEEPVVPQAVVSSYDESSEKPKKVDKFDCWMDYFIDLIRTWWNNPNTIIDPSSETANKARQLRLIMFEILEHIDWLTDFLLVMRLLSKLISPHAQRSDCIPAVLLTGLFITSTVAYFTRRYTIVHRIEGGDLWVFCPGSAFFSKVRECGINQPGVLLMYERLQLTYTLLMRILEDIPQLMVVLCLLTQDSGFLLSRSMGVGSNSRSQFLTRPPL